MITWALRLTALDPLIINFRGGIGGSAYPTHFGGEHGAQTRACSMIDHMLALDGEQAA
jgi:hypothetical protein